MLSSLSLRGLVPNLLFLGLASATPLDESLKPRASTCNTPSNRACWQDGFDIHTDYEVSTPPGTSRSYEWDVTEKTNWVGPDGEVKQYVQLVNGQFPGPTLFADWGDTITVKINNKLPDNGTSFHWHGIRQLNTQLNDGANGVTECPIPPGGSKTYTFKALQYGTSWYHSHTSAQYGNGVWGPIQIDGPASDPYDIDLGVFPIGDYYYATADELVLYTKFNGPPPSNNVMFNGTNINPNDPTKGKYAVVTLTPGKRHRLRLINPSVENNFQVSLVGHQFTIIETDFVPIDTITVDNIFMGIGQRYDVLIDASQKVGNYWFNVTMFPGSLCGASNNTTPAAIFRYDGAPTSNPTDPGTLPPNAGCQDSLNYTPVVTRTADQTGLIADASDPAHQLDVNLTSNPFVWYVNNSAIDVSWDKPVFQYVLDGDTNYPRTENLVFANENDTWAYWVVENLSVLPHPMHLHGHDFLVLGSGAGSFSASQASSLKYKNPVRRDVTMLPGSGWLVIAFKTDNPGNWLFHCHIAWHVSGGLSVDFMERRDDQLSHVSSSDLAEYKRNCANWNAYNPKPIRIDSGI